MGLNATLGSTGWTVSLDNAGQTRYPMLYGKQRPTMMLFGNSIARAQRRNGGGGGVNQVFGYGWLWWAMSFLGWPMQFVLTGDEYQVGSDANCTAADGAGGWSGGSAVQIDSVISTFLGSNRPNFVFLQCQENDPVVIDAGTSLTAIEAAYRSIINKVKAVGAQPVWIECLPSTDFSSGTRPAAYRNVVDAARRVCAELGVIYIPTIDLYTDYSLAYGGPLNSGVYANNVYSSVHPANAGITIGLRVADVLGTYGLNNFSRGILPIGAGLIHGNAGMSGSGGFLGGGYTGAAPAVTTILTDATTPTCTSTLVQVGPRQVTDVTFSCGLQAGIKNAMQVYNSTYGTTGYTVGDYVSAYTDLEFTAATSGLRTIETQCVFNGAGTQAYVNSVAAGDAAVLYAPLNRPMRIMSPAYKVPTGTTGIRETTKILLQNNVASAAFSARIYGYGVVNWSV